MNATQAVNFANIGAITTAGFYYKGGATTLTWQATLNAGNIQLQILANDGVTWLNVGAAVSALGFSSVGNLPAGQYRFVISLATANYISLASVPQG